MKNINSSALSKRGFTLMETVIAIGVLAVLLTGFLAVFTPAAQGIRRSINAQEADRLASTLERELVTARNDSHPTGFNKAFEWISDSKNPADAIFIYQYRGDPASMRPDGTPTPLPRISGLPGKDYVVQAMARLKSDPFFLDDLAAVDGAIFYVKATQLVYNASNGMEVSTEKAIVDPKTKNAVANADAYQDAVIAFSAEFFAVPSKAPNYLTGPKFSERFNGNNAKPIFVRNLAVRR